MEQVTCQQCVGKKDISYKNGLYHLYGARYYEPELGEFHSLRYRYGVWYSIAKPNAFYFDKDRLLSTRPLALSHPYCFSTCIKENIFPVALYIYLFNKPLANELNTLSATQANFQAEVYFEEYVREHILLEQEAFEEMERKIRNRLTRSGYDGIIYLHFDDPQDVFMFI